MTLGELQRTFPPLVAMLINWAYSAGYEITFGEAMRSQEQADWNAAHGKGISNSLHMKRLAIDLNLFKDGVYLTDTESYRPLGDHWKTLHADARWGGDFSKPDGNHFSLTFGGVS